MKKNRLLIDYEYDFTLLALVCQLRGFKLAWYINQLLSVKLVKEKDIQLQFTNHQSPLLIANYVFTTEHTELRLIRNLSVHESETGYLVPELKQFDFLLMLRGEGDYIDRENLSQTLQQIPGLQYLKTIDHENLKSKENLIF
jgi:hypothetical protein